MEIIYISHKNKALDYQTCNDVIDLFEKSNPTLRKEHDYYGIYPHITQDLRFSFVKPLLTKYIDEYVEKHRFFEGDINAPFDTQAYDNYQELVNNNYYDELYKEYRSMTVEEQITNLNELGKDCINKLVKIIDKLDDILEDKSGDAK